MEEIKKPWEYSRKELIEIAGQVGACIEENDFDDQWLVWRSIKIDGYRLLIFVDTDGEAFFLVDGSSKIKNSISTQKGAIFWRCFMKLWAEVIDDLKSQNPGVECFLFPEDSDGHFNRKVRFFRLLGFELVDDSKMILDN